MSDNNIVIEELVTIEEWKKAFPVMNQLRTHLNETSYTELVKEASQKDGYRLFALFSEDQIVAVIGFIPMITLYNGRFIWVCDLVTDESARSKGYGELLLTHIEELAKKEGYECISLSSGLQRTNVHRFYEEKMDYDKVSYVFLKKF
ncbi:GNAT family N-acetyltransferase [Bacillaceae bacterium S4-13-56]